MTKEELKAYISEAVDALDPVDLELLFPPNNQPDLYTVMEEMIGLKGAFHKLSGSNLKLNHEIHSLVEQAVLQQEQQEDFLLSLEKEKEEVEEKNPLNPELKSVLLKLLEMDELIQLAATSYNELPKLGWLNKNEFNKSIVSWQKGFDITLNRWKNLLQSSSLYKMGLYGEIFNPELHEAIAVKHQNNLEDNIILETEQAGFLYKGKIIRLAKVVVNKVKIPKVADVITSHKPEEIIVEHSEMETPKEVATKQKPRRKKKKGAGGRRKKRKRNRK